MTEAGAGGCFSAAFPGSWAILGTPGQVRKLGPSHGLAGQHKFGCMHFPEKLGYEM